MIKRIFKRLRIEFLRMCGNSRGGVSLYYALFHPGFMREHRGVLVGKELFKQQNGPGGCSSTKLRRNIHRLEKGLIMRPRRSVFALDYIQETIEAYRRALEHCGGAASEELAWASDVLDAYFKACAPHELIDRLRLEFEKVGRVTAAVPDRRAEALMPYVRNLLTGPPVSYEDLLRLAERRRSVRWFQQRPVDRDLIEKAVKVAALSPSACNRQPFEFRFFDDPEMRRMVASLPSGTVGFHENFPVVGVVVGNLANFYDEKDRHLIYIDGSLATMSLVYALETLGLATCCINWPDIEEYEVRAEQVLGLRSYERPVMFLAIGYPDPDGMVPYSEKKPVAQLCCWNILG